MAVLWKGRKEERFLGHLTTFLPRGRREGRRRRGRGRAGQNGNGRSRAEERRRKRGAVKLPPKNDFFLRARKRDMRRKRRRRNGS